MLCHNDLSSIILLNPIMCGADSLKIVSGYATHTMASWHINEIQTQKLPAINIELIVGMCPFDGISRDVHEGFLNLSSKTITDNQFKLTCKYVVRGAPVHTKLYLWEKQGNPFVAFSGSANYTQSAFISARRELMQECDPIEAFSYYNAIEADSMYCNHAEVEDNVMFTQKHPVLDAEESPLISLRGSDVQRITLSLLSTRTGEPGKRSGLNWGQREKRNPNEAYIPLPIKVARSGFFPSDNKHFSVITDDGIQLILRVEQANDKAITTPLNNSLIGEYFRNRVGVANGAFIDLDILTAYGRTDVTFYKLDEEQYFMDFSV